MFRKVFFGFLLVAILGSIAASGYQFGQYLAERNKTDEEKASLQFSEKGLKLA